MDVLAELIRIMPAGTIIPPEEVDQRYFRDWSYERLDARIIGLALPATTAEISALLQACSQLDVPVTLQGGRTGLAGGAVPSDHSLILSLERMNRVEQANRSNSSIIVEAGALLQVVQDMAASSDLFFPLDLGARGSCTIGGNIATNAGGNRVLRYGTMRDLVLGVELVLADGTIIEAMADLLKDNTGYDIRSLAAGSEGTLCVITKAVLRLFPIPRNVQTVLCTTKDVPNAIGLLRYLQDRFGSGLLAFEAMWPEFYHFGTTTCGRRQPLPMSDDIFVLFEVETADADDRLFLETVCDASANGLVNDAIVSRSLAENRELWSIRDSSGEFSTRLPSYIPFDVSLPMDSLQDFLEDYASSIAQVDPSAKSMVFGHLGDNNIHLCVYSEGDIGDEAGIETALYRCVGRYNGSISAEHGIGLHKREYLRFSKSEAAIGLMRSMKSALDPKNILNPGKLIPVQTG